MKILHKLNILSLVIVLAMTVSVLAVGMVIIDDILYGFAGQVLRLELSNVRQAVFQSLNRAGMLAAARTAADLQGDLRQKEGLKSVRLFIVEQPDNRIVYHPDLRAGERVAFDFVEDMFRMREGSIEYTFNGVPRYAVFTTVYPLKWLVGLSIAKEEMLEKKRDFLWAIGGITFLVLCINAFLVSFFGTRLLQRIRSALDCVNRIEEGDLTARIPSITIRDEVGHLEEGINVMSASIQQRTMEWQRAEQALQKAHEELEQKVAERTRELSEANEKLKELDRLKSMFIVSMTHELRTPLNAVIGFSSVLLTERMGRLGEEQKRNLAAILRAGKHLLALINDVLDVSRIEAGKIETLIREFDLHDLIAEAVNLISGEAQGKGLELRVEAIHLRMNTDSRRLLQCLINLLGNAVKFTNEGRVTVGAVLSPCPKEGGCVRIFVVDTGAGIREEDMPKLFQPFVRLVSPRQAVIPGTGLGLYLTRRLVTEVLRGDIMCESIYGRGSTFTLTIPVRIG